MIRNRSLRRRALGLAALVPGLLGLAAPGPARAVDTERDQAIAVELDVLGGEAGRFRPGQEVTFYFETDRDCYLALYNIDASGRIALLYPADPAGPAWVAGGRRYRVPERDESYDLVLGDASGVEVLAAVASDQPLPLERWFPDGRLADPAEIYDYEGLEAEGLGEETWVREDPFLAMELVNERLVPERRRADGYGDTFLSLRVGEGPEEVETAYDYPVSRRIEIIHRYEYDPYGWDPFWWDPVVVHAGYYHPWWYGRPRPVFIYAAYDPYWGPWDPWDPWDRWDSWGCGWGAGATMYWGWGGPAVRHVVVHEYPGDYWGSRIKWKTAQSPRPGAVVKWKEGEVQPVSAALRGVKTPPAQVALGGGKYRLEPGTPRAPEKIRPVGAGSSVRKPSAPDRRASGSGEKPVRERERVTVREQPKTDRERVERKSESVRQSKEKERSGSAEKPAPSAKGKAEPAKKSKESSGVKSPPAEKGREQRGAERSSASAREPSGGARGAKTGTASRGDRRTR